MKQPDAPTQARAKFIVDLALWVSAGVLAFPLRHVSGWSDEPDDIYAFVVASMLVAALMIRLFRLNRQSWRQVTVKDLETLLKAIGVGTAILFVTGLGWHAAHGFPRTVALIQGLLAVVLLGGTRLALRLWHEENGRAEAASSTPERRVLLVGAGDAGARIARDMRRHPKTGMVPVGFLDDSTLKRSLTVGGLRILGTLEDLPAVVAAQRVDLVLISMPSAPGARTRRVVELARLAGVPCRILPGVTEILAGEVDMFRVRRVQVEDLLRRPPIELDLESPGDYIAERTVLVTGAGGSIGSEIVRQVARLNPDAIVLFGQGENSLHAIAHELDRETPKLDHAVVVGSVRDRHKLDQVFAAFRPDVVFHAAAHKHVPLMERDPDEAILNNVGGTKHLTEAALEAGVGRFVNISSDKAVNPASMVGATKHLAEKVVRALSEQATADRAYVSVRFGNVLGSRGSVVPIFQEQIRRGGPITLTHPDMTRYFMTIPEASRLVIQAGALGSNGAVYILDMGTPVRIRDLADDMIRLAGLDTDEIEVVYTGLRPGEKLTEELFTPDEHADGTRFAQILVGRSEEPIGAGFLHEVDDLLGAASRRDWEAMEPLLRRLVPGFVLGDRGTLQRSAEGHG